MPIPEHTVIQTILRERIEILAYINSFLDDAHLAEDCFQEVCVAGIKQRARFSDGPHVFRWTFTTARNKAIDAARKRTRQPIALDRDVLDLLETQWTEESASALLNANVQVRELKRCLETLNENNRKIIELRYFDGLNSSRIAKILGRNVEAVYKAITRIHTALKTCVDRQLEDESKRFAT
ncbi:MAG: sigma-70 family RNA polymerase sigma factor [Opitutales bacterium]|jgi:RNA polymerase sigma-70 factor, ECF subfamily|nr:sigma-70 family RNA polymerase sigma factor [Opitutales bacterium]